MHGRQAQPSSATNNQGCHPLSTRQVNRGYNKHMMLQEGAIVMAASGVGGGGGMGGRHQVTHDTQQMVAMVYSYHSHPTQFDFKMAVHSTRHLPNQ